MSNFDMAVLDSATEPCRRHFPVLTRRRPAVHRRAAIPPSPRRVADDGPGYHRL